MQAQALNKKIAALEPVDLIVTSPLTRAMERKSVAPLLSANPTEKFH
jgi:broad specificity phosphatase PhoE